MAEQLVLDRRGTIIAAALECFDREGVLGTSIEDIRALSGASIGSIYHHFGSKERLAVMVYMECGLDYQRGFLSTLRAASDTESGIKNAVRYHLTWVENHVTAARYLFAGSPATARKKSSRERWNGDFIKEILGWLQARVQAGDLRAVTPDLYNAIWVGPSQEFARRWLGGNVDTPIEEARDVLAEAAWQALRADTV